MKLDRNIPQDEVDLDALPNSELPNGGARALTRDGTQPPPTLRTLQARRKLAFKSLRATEDPGVRAVPSGLKERCSRPSFAYSRW